jgi:hypothetical protein
LRSKNNVRPQASIMTKAEFLKINREILRRQNRRRLYAIPLLLFIFAALGLVPLSFPHRDLYVWGVIIVSGACLIFLIRFVFRGTTEDSKELGSVCPKCNKLLNVWRGVRIVVIRFLTMLWPNKSPEPTAVGAVSSAVAVHVASRRWLSFLR